MTFPQGAEWIVIGLLVIVLFGAKKLPELGSSVGKTITNFRKGVEEGKADEAEAEGDETAAEAEGRTRDEA